MHKRSAMNVPRVMMAVVQSMHEEEHARKLQEACRKSSQTSSRRDLRYRTMWTCAKAMRSQRQGRGHAKGRGGPRRPRRAKEAEEGQGAPKDRKLQKKRSGDSRRPGRTMDRALRRRSDERERGDDEVTQDEEVTPNEEVPQEKVKKWSKRTTRRSPRARRRVGTPTREQRPRRRSVNWLKSTTRRTAPRGGAREERARTCPSSRGAAHACNAVPRRSVRM